MISANSAYSISIREIQQTVALAFNLSVRDMVSPQPPATGYLRAPRRDVPQP